MKLRYRIYLFIYNIWFILHKIRNSILSFYYKFKHPKNKKLMKEVKDKYE